MSAPAPERAGVVAPGRDMDLRAAEVARHGRRFRPRTSLGLLQFAFDRHFDRIAVSLRSVWSCRVPGPPRATRVESRPEAPVLVRGALPVLRRPPGATPPPARIAPCRVAGGRAGDLAVRLLAAEQLPDPSRDDLRSGIVGPPASRARQDRPHRNGVARVQRGRPVGPAGAGLAPSRRRSGSLAAAARPQAVTAHRAALGSRGADPDGSRDSRRLAVRIGRERRAILRVLSRVLRRDRGSRPLCHASGLRERMLRA